MKHILLALALVIPRAYANDACDTPVTDMVMLNCAGRELSTADKKLNDVYGKLFGKLDGEAQRKLKEAQRAWIKFRDLNAEFYGDINRGGSAEPLNIVSTKAQLTRMRIKELQDELERRN